MNYLNPVSFLDTINYKIGYQLYLFIKTHNTHSHLIIHGRKYSGKTLLIQSLFRDLYQGEPILQENENFKVFTHTNYYLFDCNAIYNKQSAIALELIEHPNISKSINYLDFIIFIG